MGSITASPSGKTLERISVCFISGWAYASHEFLYRTVSCCSVKYSPFFVSFVSPLKSCCVAPVLGRNTFSSQVLGVLGALKHTQFSAVSTVSRFQMEKIRYKKLSAELPGGNVASGRAA